MLVSEQGRQTRFLNITGVTQSVRVKDGQGGFRDVKVDPGIELISSDEPIKESDVRAADGVARRNVHVSGKIATAQFDLASLIRDNGELRRIVLRPVSNAEKRLGNSLMKTAASLLAIRGGDGFEQTPPPVVPPVVPGADGGSGSGGGSGSSVATQTVNQSIAPVPQTPSQSAAAQSTVAQSAVVANPRATNTFDQTRPIVNNTTPRETPRRIAAIPPATNQSPPPRLRLYPPPAAATDSQYRLPAKDILTTEIASTFPTKTAPVLPAHNLQYHRAASQPRQGAHAERSRDGVVAAVHSQLKRTVQEHPTLAIVLIAIFGLMCAIMGALAVAFYKSRREVDRLNRGLQAKLAELNELNDELTRTRDKAIEGSRLKSEFVANISHEIRTPITAVLGMIGLLREGEHDARETELMKMLDESARSLLNVINDILDFSKIEAGMLVIQSVDFRVAEVARDVTELMSGAAREKGIELNLNIDPSCDNFVRGDPFRLRQVLVNLLGNAIKFTNQGAVTLLVQAEASEHAQNLVSFHVKDTGIGISADARNRLFLPFSQADGTTTRRFGGTGLGLSISRKLVELMGGRIDFASEVGLGSHFWFAIPFDAAESEPTNAPAGKTALTPRSTPVAPRRILVAEDSTVLQKIIVHQLKKLHYDVVLVDTGLGAVEAIKNEKFDLILMDWQMPELDGIQATKQIRELAEGGSVPIIAMTANAMEGDRLSCLNAGMNDYISKPFTLEQLQKAIEMWLPVNSTPSS